MTIEEANARFDELIETAVKATGEERVLQLYREYNERIAQLPKYELQSQEQRDAVIIRKALILFLGEILKTYGKV